MQPLLQQRLELAHVLKAQIEGFKSRDGGLTEVIAIQLSHRQPHISLYVGIEREELETQASSLLCPTILAPTTHTENLQAPAHHLLAPFHVFSLSEGEFGSFPAPDSEWVVPMCLTPCLALIPPLSPSSVLSFLTLDNCVLFPGT